MHLRMLFMLCLLCWPAVGRAAIHILIDQPEDQRFPIAIADILRGPEYRGSSRTLKKLPDVIRNDLMLSGYFFVIAPRIYSDKSESVERHSIPWHKWTGIGARGLVKGIALREDGGRITLQLRLFDTMTKELQMGKQYTFHPDDWRNIAHRFSDDIMQATTGRRGPFSTRIAYSVQTKRSKKKRWKQLFVSDMDGANLRRVTSERTYNLAPNWAPDGQQLVYASYANDFPDIYVLDLRSGNNRRLTANRSTNITPTFSPDGSLIAFSSGQVRDMELYLMSNLGTDEHIFAPSFGIDISPSFSPDGSEIVFASERGGKLHLYKKAIYGEGAAARLTFEGSQNDSPDWSPDGTKIVYTRFLWGKYDIFTCNPNGSDHRQITFYGSNEHPRWSPDSRYLVYSSTTDGKSNIFIMRHDGANKTQISRGKPATLPDWGPWPQDYWD